MSKLALPVIQILIKIVNYIILVNAIKSYNVAQPTEASDESNITPGICKRIKNFFTKNRLFKPKSEVDYYAYYSDNEKCYNGFSDGVFNELGKRNDDEEEKSDDEESSNLSPEKYGEKIGAMMTRSNDILSKIIPNQHDTKHWPEYIRDFYNSCGCYADYIKNQKPKKSKKPRRSCFLN